MHNKTEHLLTILAEECAEVAQEACKAIRFGLEDVNPKDPEAGDNRRRIERELGQLLAVAKELGLKIHEEDALLKLKRIDKYMAYARERGTLEAS